MSNEELCITILITFGIFHIALLRVIDAIQKILKKLRINNMKILVDKFLRKRKTDHKNTRRIK